MNATTSTELAAVAKTQSAVDAMAVVTLSPEKYAAEVYQPFKSRLVDAIDGVKAIDYDIKTTAGMAVAIKARAMFRDLRIEADKERKARKEPITKIGKLLESHFDLVEERITPLEALFDGDIQAELERKEAEKAAKIAAEVERARKIADAIEGIRERETDLIRLTKTAAEAQAEIDSLAALEITEEIYQERLHEAQTLKASVLDAMCMVRGTRFESEAAALAAEDARKAEAARIEQERAALAAQRAENERIANEQAATAKRLADQEAAQALVAKQLADKAAANLRAEREAQELAMRLAREKSDKEQAERDRVAADTKRQLDEQQAAIAAERKAMEDERAAAVQLIADHAEALIEDAQRDADLDTRHEREQLDNLAQDDAAADLARCTETAKAMLSNGRSLVLPESYCERDAMADAGVVEWSGNDIINVVMFEFNWSYDEAEKNMQSIDYAAARKERLAGMED